ncbi:chondroadherin-like protein [Microcaecilia unicolor]|uniref:Chondroadherin-like protein n=1 Tax=Microcaecilia unicolor TaxID=1415580 RepID=A0A6P7WXH1_9AMPH|nr:chondroadherin-like protein [Microcaecilia unicolor]
MLTFANLVLFYLTLAGTGRSERCPQFCICDNIKHSVTCVNKNLTRVPVTIPQLTNKLDIHGNNIKVIPGSAFLPIPYLTHLNMQKCNIETIEEGAFRGLGRLVYLNLGSNNIAFIYQESFDGLSFLQQLVLENNHIEEIKPGAFSQLGFLNLLNLGNNFLVYLPDMIFQGLHQIKWINLSNNTLNIVADQAFAGLPTLKRLSLDHNELQYLPNEALSKLSGVTRLDLGWNPLTFIGEEAVQMDSLKQVFLNDMALQDVSHNAFEKSPSLTLIDFQNNQLKMMQPMTGLKQIKKVNLKGNPIHCNCYMRPFKEWVDKSTIQANTVCSSPISFRGEHLESLRAIDLKCDSNISEVEEEQVPAPITSTEEFTSCPQNCVCRPDLLHVSCENKGHRKIPKGFPANTRLLDLQRNEFHTVPKNSFPDLKNLVSLHLQNCHIAELQSRAFLGMKKMIYLYLSNNKLSTINTAAFEGIPQLTYLYLDHNQFTKIPKGAFKFLPNLFALHLQYNSISFLSDDMMTGAEKLRWLCLTGNNINYVSPMALHATEELEKLHLDENVLSEVPTSALLNLPMLGELKLSKNPIKYIGNGAFLPVASSLQHLYLDNLGLEKISAGAFAGLGPGMRSLYLENNKLPNLPSMNNFTNLEVIDLGDNPFVCNCQLLPLHRWIEKLNLKVDATCELPANVHGQRVKDISFKTCLGWKEEKPKSTEHKVKTNKKPIKRSQKIPNTSKGMINKSR